jgi:predicted ATPase
MISMIEALNYRCLRYVRQPVGSFHVLVGPNSSGKTTFLDVMSFLGRLVSEGLDDAVGERTKNFHDLVWRRAGTSFELAIEATIPGERLEKLANKKDTVRYEVSLGIETKTGEMSILAERVVLKASSSPRVVQRNLFPSPPEPPHSLLAPRSQGMKTIVNKVAGANDNFYDEQ